MRIYQHYSFDLWMTLIRSNPSFKQERAQYFFERFNHQGLSLSKIALIFRQVDLLCNAINEKTGHNIDAEEMYLLVIGAMNEYDEIAVKEVDIERLYADMEAIFLAHPPVLYDDFALKVLDSLSAATNNTCTFSLLSNTAFIKGLTIRKVLPGLGLGGLFAFELYSDEAGLSKPNPQFFQLMLERITGHRGETDPAHIIHVGDNPEADEKGARAVGIDSLLVHSNGQELSALVTGLPALPRIPLSPDFP